MKLNADEIDESNARLVERHPLYYADMSLADIFPFLKCLSGVRLPLSRRKEVDSFLESEDERSDGIRQGKKEHERYNKILTQKMKSRKGFLTLGYGFVAYFQFMEFAIILFTLLTILAIPSMYFYWNFRPADERTSWMTKLQMGNLGYSSALCRDVHLGVGKLTLSCDTGVIKDVVAFGIIPENSKILDACLPNQETEKCSSVLNEPEVIKIINDKCLDKDICSFDVLSLVKPGNSTDTK